MNERPRRSQARRLTANPHTTQPGLASRRHRPDYWLLILAALLLTIGLVVVYSISPGLAASQNISQSYFITKQLIDVALGIVAFAVVALFPISYWRKLVRPLIIAAVAASVLVMLMPVDEIYQAHRWIRVGGFSFQVAELIKLALLLGVASFLTQQWRAGKLTDNRTTLRPLVFLVLAVGIVVAKLQSDLGSAAVMIAMVAAAAFAVNIPLKRIALIGSLILVLFGVAIVTSNYRRERLMTFLHPETNCQTTSYQACQALISVGSGGLLGLGLGHSVQAYGYQPEASNDSIFAIMAEKFGFIGSSAIILIYAAFIARLHRIAIRTSDQFNRLLVVGVLAWLSTQMIINIGSMLGLLPLKGITLPLISQGGTSLVFLAVALGLVFQISRYTSYNVTEPPNLGEKPNNSFNGRRLGRPYSTAFAARPRS